MFSKVRGVVVEEVGSRLEGDSSTLDSETLHGRGRAARAKATREVRRVLCSLYPQ